MEGSVLSFLKAEWKVNDTGSAHWSSTLNSEHLSVMIDLLFSCILFSSVKIYYYINFIWKTVSLMQWLVWSPRLQEIMGSILGQVKPKTKHAALRCKSKDRLARNQDNVSEWSIMSTHGLLFECTRTMKIPQSVLFLYKVEIIIILVNLTCSRHDLAEKLLIWRWTKITHSHNFILTSLVCVR